MKHKSSLSMLIVLATAFMVSCGGGGNGAAPAGTQGTTPVTSVGTITAFGSIFVNEVEYETLEAVFRIEGDDTPSQADLAVGMKVKVRGEINDDGRTGKALEVEFEDELEGPISALAVSSTGTRKTITVLGQQIHIDEGVTMFDNKDPAFDAFVDLDASSIGIVVEVSGNRMSDGSILANFIEKTANDLAAFLAIPKELEIMGTVSALDDVNKTFQIGTLLVDYSNAPPRNLQNAPGGIFANGLTVEVKGNDLTNNVLTATDVEVKVEGLGEANREKAEVEGLISDLNTIAQTFVVNGQPVDYSGAVFEGGLEEELVNDLKVEAEGPIVNSVLAAVKVKFEESIKLEDNISAINGNAITLQLLGLTLLVDDSITMIDAPDTLATLSVGNSLRIRARQSGANLLALRITKQSDTPVDRIILQGAVESFSQATGEVVILGITVDTSTISDADFQIENTSIGRAAFFAQLANGRIVKARNRGGVWDQIELEI